MTRTRIVWAVLVCSLLLNTWLLYRTYRTESGNRQALAYSAERVAYRLTQLTQFANDIPESDWAKLSTRTWLYDSLREVIDHGLAAERIPTRGEPAEVAGKLGLLARRLERYRDDAHRVAFVATDGRAEEDRANLQKLARAIHDAGWAPPEEAGKPAGWTYGRNWAELNQALTQLLAQNW